MRNVIQRAIPADPTLGRRGVHHFGLAYDLLGPPPVRAGRADDAKRETWLNACSDISVDPDYRVHFDRWRASFPEREATILEVTARSRILIGHGNASASEVGLTVHRTWGVPVIPGSALKGVMAHYVDATYGDDGPHESEQRKWRGPTLRNGHIDSGKGAGEHFGRLFGAAPVEADGLSGRRGLVDFHDALFVPGSVGDKPFARDVLTVHHSTYYRKSGTAGAPNDWEDPVPVPFITVKPKTRFLLVLTCPDEAWRRLAMRFLSEALSTWGIGGKTSAGYGRLG